MQAGDIVSIKSRGEICLPTFGRIVSCVKELGQDAYVIELPEPYYGMQFVILQKSFLGRFNPKIDVDVNGKSSIIPT